MNILNYTEFRNKLKPTLDSVVDDGETIVINRGEQNNAVIISLKEYNAMLETLHLLSTKNNTQRLYDAIARDKKKQYIVKALKEKE
jgi:antitoxin YefM